MKHVGSASLSAEVYRMAVERIEALSGCTEESEEEQELIHWAEIAAAYDRSVSTPP